MRVHEADFGYLARDASLQVRVELESEAAEEDHGRGKLRAGGDPDDDGSSNGNTITGPFERGIQISQNSYGEIKANNVTGYEREGIIINRNSSARIGSDNDRDTYDSSMRSNYGNTLDGFCPSRRKC